MKTIDPLLYWWLLFVTMVALEGGTVSYLLGCVGSIICFFIATWRLGRQP